MAIYSLWGSIPSDICEDGDTFLELVSDINACLGFKKKMAFPWKYLFVRLCEDEGMQITLIFQNKRLGVIYIK